MNVLASAFRSRLVNPDSTPEPGSVFTFRRTGATVERVRSAPRQCARMLETRAKRMVVEQWSFGGAASRSYGPRRNSMDSSMSRDYPSKTSRDFGAHQMHRTRPFRMVCRQLLPYPLTEGLPSSDHNRGLNPVEPPINTTRLYGDGF